MFAEDAGHANACRSRIFLPRPDRARGWSVRLRPHALRSARSACLSHVL